MKDHDTRLHTSSKGASAGDAAKGVVIDDALLECLLRDAHGAGRFEREVLGGALGGGEGTTLARSGGLRWRGALVSGVTGGLAAAAALTAALVLRPTMPGLGSGAPRSEGPGAMARGGEGGASEAGSAEGSGGVGGSSQGRYLTPDEVMGQLERFARLDPGIREGLPSLSADRTMMVAVSRDVQPGCECFDWVVESPDAAPEAKPAIARAVRESCGVPDEDVVVFAITGPRGMLPFHEDDAQAIAACLVQSAAASQPEGASREALTLAAIAAQDCVPQGLTVQASWR
jgi:hypothetical protein